MKLWAQSTEGFVQDCLTDSWLLWGRLRSANGLLWLWRTLSFCGWRNGLVCSGPPTSPYMACDWKRNLLAPCASLRVSWTLLTTDMPLQHMWGCTGNPASLCSGNLAWRDTSRKWSKNNWGPGLGDWECRYSKTKDSSARAVDRFSARTPVMQSFFLLKQLLEYRAEGWARELHCSSRERPSEKTNPPLWQLGRPCKSHDV